MERNSRRKWEGIFSSSAPFFVQISAYISIGFVTLMFLIQTNKTLIAKQKQMMITADPQANYIYDPDYGVRMCHVCLLAENAHQTKYKDSPCTNKTFIGWYSPWARHHFWEELWKDKDEKRKERQELGKEIRKNEKATEKVIGTAEKPEGSSTVLSEDDEDMKEKTVDEESQAKKKQKRLEMLYSILVTLLLLSSMAACWEVAKDKMMNTQAAHSKNRQNRRCNLANFTMNRHLRRESQQQNSSSLPRQGSLELRSKVTQTFIHQSSLDRASPKMSSEALNPRTERRYSVPAALFGDDNPASRVTTVSTPLIRVQRMSSIDVTLTEDINLDARKKPRHFIRRH